MLLTYMERNSNIINKVFNRHQRYQKTEENRMDRKKIIKEAASWIIIILVAFTIGSLFSSRVYAKVQVKQSSMENTLFEGQYLLVDEFSYLSSDPKKGDIIIFFENEEKGNIFNDMGRTIDNMLSIFDRSGEEKHERLVKRVIGVEGDKVDIKDGSVYINDIKLEEPYAVGKTYPRELKFPITVGENELFVLGDHREVSSDSRSFGLVNFNRLEEKAIYRIFPFNKMGKIQ